jgi:F-type H+-transporting ATPase subunit delta
MAAFAPRYAAALADVVLGDRLDPARVLAQLEDFAATFAGSRDLREALLDPVLPAAKRVEILRAVTQQSPIEPKLLNFLAVLIDHGRLGSLDEILLEYRLEMNRRQGISEAEITTAHPLDPGERAEVERQVAALAGTKIRATWREDKSLIGGAIVRIASTVYDGSVRGRLEQLKERLMSDTSFTLS